MNNGDYNWKAVLGPTAGCAGVAELVMLLEGRRGGDRRAQANAHLAACPHCQSELALLNAFEQPAGNIDEQSAIDSIVADLRANSPVPKRESWWRRFAKPRFMVPATVALAASLATLSVVLPWRRSAENPFPPGDEVMRSQAVAVVEPLGGVAQAPRELRWRPVQSATLYQVRLREVDRTELWSSSTAAVAVSLPDTVQRMLTPKKTVTWEVEAYDSSGHKIASSGLQRFYVLGERQP